jgi:hypothetical protein
VGVLSVRAVANVNRNAAPVAGSHGARGAANYLRNHLLLLINN